MFFKKRTSPVRLTSKNGYHPNELPPMGTPVVDETADWTKIFEILKRAIKDSNNKEVTLPKNAKNRKFSLGKGSSFHETIGYR